MKEMIAYAKEQIETWTIGTTVGVTVLFVECFWALIYTITKFWSWGYFIEEIGLIYALFIVTEILIAIGGAFYEMYKESEKNTVE